jgi:predicted AlkP superfamily pyrophosphatase or phosphodiesterase
VNHFKSVTQLVLIFLVSVCLSAQSDLSKREKKSKEKPLPLTSHVILISIDGLRLEDLNNPKLKLPTLKALRERGSVVLNFESIYPSQSLPAHATIITGMLPADHGITSDLPFDEKRGQTASGKYLASEIKADTIWQAAKRAELKTATINFPLTEKAELDFVAQEISSIYELLVNQRPRLLLVRFEEVANSLRQFGVGSTEATRAIETVDAALKTMIDSVERARLTSETTFVLISSHGYARVEQEFRPNITLARKGLLTVDANGKIRSWIAATYSSGGAAAIYLQDQNNQETTQLLEEVFAEIHQKDASPLWRVLSKKDAAKLGADPRAALFLEAAPGFVISEQAKGKKETDKLNDIAVRAASGYLPSRSEMRGMLLMAGKGIKPKTQIEYAHLVDIAPTIARLLGFELKASRGHAISAILAQ